MRYLHRTSVSTNKPASNNRNKRIPIYQKSESSRIQGEGRVVTYTGRKVWVVIYKEKRVELDVKRSRHSLKVGVDRWSEIATDSCCQSWVLVIEVNEMLSYRQVKDFAFFQGWGLPISFAYPSSVKPSWRHLSGKSKALQTRMFVRDFFYLSYTKPASEYHLQVRRLSRSKRS